MFLKLTLQAVKNAKRRNKRTIKMQPLLSFVLIGFLGGFAAGLFGIGGGILIIPGLIFFAGFSQHMATGTSLAVLLPPIGLAAALEYYRQGHVDVWAAIILASIMFPSAWIGAHYANQIEGPYLRLMFGLFVCAVGVYIMFGACRSLKWF